jgi:hypothetical protein
MGQMTDRMTQMQKEHMQQMLEAVDSPREIEIRRDAKGKPAGAVSRKVKK